MSDPRIVEYLRQNASSYPVESLKAALVKQGFSHEDVEAAAAEALGAAPPPPSPEEAGGQPAPARPAASPDGPVDFSLKNLVANAKAMIGTPETFFRRLDPHGRIGPAFLTVLAWSAIGGLFSAGTAFVTAGDAIQRMAAGMMVVILPVLAAMLSFLAAGFYHLVCKLLGGTAPYAGSYQVMAGLAALFPISALAAVVPLGSVPVQLYGLYLSVLAAAGVHGIARKKAWIAFGSLTALGLFFSWQAHRAAEQWKAALQPGPGIGALGGPGSRGFSPEDAQRMAEALGGAGGDEQAAAMQQGMAQAARIMQDMNAYAGMAEPPEETLALLDADGAERLREVWPGMPGMMRSSVVQSLPTVEPAQRGQFLEQFLAATQNANRMLQQAMQGLEQQQPARRRAPSREAGGR